jgi:5-(aminomethyl)-3-furanmethanol phosphate kinase
MWVVKLGGSLARSDNLRHWLRVLAEAQSLVVVPGGGPFADQVREAQSQWGFDDSSAHYMALLAMEQYGVMLCGLQPGLVAVHSIPEMLAALEGSLTPVWMPSRLVLGESDIAHSWEVTSDSLAAWLSGRLGADKLVLVKSIAIEGGEQTAASLCASEVMDLQFGEYLCSCGVPAWTVAERDYLRFEQLRRGDMASATRIHATRAG